MSEFCIVLCPLAVIHKSVIHTLISTLVTVSISASLRAETHQADTKELAVTKTHCCVSSCHLVWAKKWHLNTSQRLLLTTLFACFRHFCLSSAKINSQSSPLERERCRFNLSNRLLVPTVRDTLQKTGQTHAHRQPGVGWWLTAGWLGVP